MKDLLEVFGWKKNVKSQKIEGGASIRAGAFIRRNTVILIVISNKIVDISSFFFLGKHVSVERITQYNILTALSFYKNRLKIKLTYIIILYTYI